MLSPSPGTNSKFALFKSVHLRLMIVMWLVGIFQESNSLTKTFGPCHVQRLSIVANGGVLIQMSTSRRSHFPHSF